MVDVEMDDEEMELLEGEVFFELFVLLFVLDVDLNYVVYNIVYDEEIGVEELVELVELECLWVYLD